ncbi:MAG: hypothetical protein ABSF00_02925 [Candidatus Bathyarchaeia archaeon]|jgi:hypothetical protein
MQKDDPKLAILDEIRKSELPLAVENIRTACKIANWNTVLKHCLELLLADEIRGAKTSKSWVFWDKSLYDKADKKTLGGRSEKTNGRGGDCD